MTSNQERAAEVLTNNLLAGNRQLNPEQVASVVQILTNASLLAPDEWIDAEKVRGVLDILDKRSDAAYRAHKANPEDVHEDGKAIAYEQAVSLIQHALGGTP